jgi:hypothetical protein
VLLCGGVVAAPQASHAAGSPNNHGVAVGTLEPTGLPTRSAAHQQIYDLKLQLGQLLANQQPVPQSLITRLRTLTNNPRIGLTGASSTPFTYTPTGSSNGVSAYSSGVSPNYLSNGVYYATVDGGVSNYEEPSSLPSILTSRGDGSNFYGNMCGPGSATKLLSDYISGTINSYSNSTLAGPGYTPQQNYMMYLAVSASNSGGTSNPGVVWTNDGMMNTNDHNPPTNGAPNTQNGDEANVINQVLGYSFFYTYGTDYPGDGAARFNTSQYPLSQFTFELYSDLESSGVPMVMAADTHGLQGWWPNSQGGWAIHLVAINGYNPSTSSLWYFDSASNGSAYGNHVNYSHTNLPISNVVGSNNGLIDSVW